MAKDGKGFRYQSYVQDIMGPMFFDYGFGPFRWVCTSGKAEDLELTDNIAKSVLDELMKSSPDDIKSQMADNIQWIEGAQENKLVVGSEARILYADSTGRIKIASEFNKAIKDGRLSGPVVLGSQFRRREIGLPSNGVSPQLPGELAAASAPARRAARHAG